MHYFSSQVEVFQSNVVGAMGQHGLCGGSLFLFLHMVQIWVQTAQDGTKVRL